MDIKKAKGTSDTTQSDHIERKIIPKNADPTRTHLNRVLVEYPDGVHGRDEAIAHRLNTAGILELEDEARQRERQQAEQIQEIRNAYEQQHRKLSEFTDFVRRYFPYVEKLIPVVNFLRERLGFNDGIIRRLCEFKEVGIKGKLYSSEFNRSFDTRHSVCSIKQDESGKFDFKIDGVSHVNWFRKKMNEFREAMGIPKQKQDRGIKL